MKPPRVDRRRVFLRVHKLGFFHEIAIRDDAGSLRRATAEECQAVLATNAWLVEPAMADDVARKRR